MKCKDFSISASDMLLYYFGDIIFANHCILYFVLFFIHVLHSDTTYLELILYNKPFLFLGSKPVDLN